MTDNKKTPDIRFQGFTDAWEQWKLGEVFDFLQNNTLSRAELNTENGTAKNVHYGDVLIKFGEFLDVSKVQLPFIESKQITEKFKGSFLHDGDVVMADTAEDETAGKCTEIYRLDNIPTISGLHTIPLRPRVKFAVGYLGCYMNSNFYHDQLLPLMQGIKVISVSKGSIKNTDIVFPSKIEEQSAIGNFFIHLDALITLHQRKCEKLKNIKKSMLEKMFPREGEKFPEIRFAGFTDAWEQRKLGEITNILSASRVHKNEWKNEGIPFYRSSDVVAAFKGNDNEKVYISKELYKELIKSSGRLEQGDILVTGGGSIGIPFIVSNDEPLYSKDADLIWIKKSRNFESKFLYTYFTSQRFREYISGISHVGTIAHYTIEQVKDTLILLPNITEQTLIGNFFSRLDTLIALHQRKCEKLKKVKSAMLERMFV